MKLLCIDFLLEPLVVLVGVLLDQVYTFEIVMKSNSVVKSGKSITSGRIILDSIPSVSGKQLWC